MVHNLLAWLLVSGYVPMFHVWLGLYTVAYQCSHRTATLGLLSALAPTALNIIDEVRIATPDNRTDAFAVATVVGMMINLAVFGAGRWAAWMVRHRHLEAERAAADAVAAERRRITRDLHDIVAHAVSLIVLQAAGAARVLRKDPGRAEVALQNVDELGQQAIVELRRMLDLLADSSDYPSYSTAQPLPRLRDISALLERMRASAMRIELNTTGDPVPLAPGVDLSAYRIVQEALTNSTRYADPNQPIHVQVRWHPGELEIQIRDHGPVVRSSAAHSLSTGQGLLGMQERAAAVGGRFHAGPHPNGGFLVTVTFPVTRTPAPVAAPGENDSELRRMPAAAQQP
ncbi:sensor histidine kinase [Streptomyces sp. NPDC056486]|uniref:sensor histidine kinase n=1 Tax=Streptomyces sp. NPDC056486 TaxID=3345835 RepID=UPI0036CE86D4